MPIIIRRCLAAALMYTMTLTVLAALHDYPQLRQQLQKVRQHHIIAEQRQWLFFFYFVNEASSGLKFFVTGNEGHMAHYPSASHLLAARTAQALAGSWHMQIRVAEMYYKGEFTPQDRQESLRWLRLARDSAASDEQAQAAATLIEQVAAASEQ